MKPKWAPRRRRGARPLRHLRNIRHSMAKMAFSKAVLTYEFAGCSVQQDSLEKGKPDEVQRACCDHRIDVFARIGQFGRMSVRTILAHEHAGHDSTWFGMFVRHWRFLALFTHPEWCP